MGGFFSGSKFKTFYFSKFVVDNFSNIINIVLKGVKQTKSIINQMIRIYVIIVLTFQNYLIRTLIIINIIN